MSRVIRVACTFHAGVFMEIEKEKLLHLEEILFPSNSEILSLGKHSVGKSGGWRV